MTEVQQPAALSVVIPVYNEATTLGLILREVGNALPQVSKQIVIVDDCSSDGTTEWLKRNLGSTHGVWHGSDQRQHQRPVVRIIFEVGILDDHYRQQKCLIERLLMSSMVRALIADHTAPSITIIIWVTGLFP
jgi:glycosyltransferase involved in cell wall biosynthesis